MLIQQAILLVLSVAGGLIWWSYDYGGVNPTPLWMPALLVWISQSMFWFGWFTRDLKLLVYLAGAWVGVMAALAVIATFIGGGVAASADVTAIRVALLAILLVPVLLMPRFRSVWPGAELPRNVGVHAGRSLFVVLQYAGVGLLMMSLIQPVLDADKTSEGQTPEPAQTEAPSASD
jgi:hypothetical protein